MCVCVRESHGVPINSNVNDRQTGLEVPLWVSRNLDGNLNNRSGVSPDTKDTGLEMPCIPIRPVLGPKLS